MIHKGLPLCSLLVVFTMTSSSSILMTWNIARSQSFDVNNLSLSTTTLTGLLID